MMIMKGEFSSIAYLIWKGSYNLDSRRPTKDLSIAYLIWKGSYNNGRRRLNNY